MTADDELRDLLGQQVVVDTRSSYIHLGTLHSFGECFVTLRDVDVHDINDSHSTKEVYIMNARRLGIQRNRASVKILRTDVVSVSLLSDVLVFE